MRINRISMILAMCLAAACANTDQTDDSSDMTPDEVAALPDAVTDVDHADAELAQLLAAEVPQDDAATFDTDDATAPVDTAVDDNDDPSDDATTPPTTIYFLPLLKWGLHPRASDALRSAGVSSWRIMQTIGNAAASAGTHAQDGTVNGHPYSSATDISVSGLSSSQIANLLERLAKVGFAAWYRHTGHDGWYGVNHIHAVYANSKMKSSLRSQVYSWLAGRNGLVGNAHYYFHTWSAAAHAVVQHKFAQSAHGTTNSGSDCFVGGLYCGGDKISGNTSYLYRCTGTGAPTLVHACTHGCAVHSGTNDACK